MKAAFAIWNNRIAPVFDVTRRIVVVEFDSGRIIDEHHETLPDNVLSQKALRLAELGIETLVCGAISRSLQTMVAGRGVRVIAFIAGDVQEVIQAWFAGTLAQGVFAMPGCRRRRRRHVDDINQEGYLMGGRNRNGKESCRDRGQGWSGQGSRGMGRPPVATNADSYCVCLQCGHKERHERGIPCTQQQCPQCGINMTRQ